MALLGVALLARATAGQVVQRVIDGDALMVTGIGIVWLIVLDSPETIDSRKMVQQFGKEASAFLHALLQTQTLANR